HNERGGQDKAEPGPPNVTGTEVRVDGGAHM
ncbi:MAG: hypothetical protein QG655_3510, partial [Actinomycetota bacterium]|nr:hypothetical protein [Actinomycetota bacterium]